LAQYARDYTAIRATGTDVAALSVDSPARAAALRTQLQLPFLLLCDPARAVVREWDLYNAREMGGIEIPSVFVIGPDRSIQYRSVDATSKRVGTEGILESLRGKSGPQTIGRERVRAGLRDFARAFGNALRRGARTRQR
jgi:peroxiredoxin